MKPFIVRCARFALAASAIAILGITGAAGMSWAAPAGNFRAYGQGHEPAITPDCSSSGLNLCPGSDTCACTPIAGKGTAVVMGGAITYTATVATDLSVSVGDCSAAFGTATLVSAVTPSNKLVINFSGSLCPTPAANNTSATANALNAVYFVDGVNSKGIFHNATGSGNVSGSRDANVAILGSVIGTVKLP